MKKLLIDSKLLIFIIIIFFNSCLTINSKMKINSNGSGYMTVEYQLEQGLVGISSLGSTDDFTPLNLGEDYIIQMIGSRSDIKYEDYSISEDNNLYTVNVTFIFDNIDALNSILPKENGITLIRKDGDTIFQQNIVAQTEEGINKESLEILNDIYKNHTFTLEVQVPGNIKSVTQGKNIDNSVALYHEQFIDIITDNEKKEWSIRW